MILLKRVTAGALLAFAAGSLAYVIAGGPAGEPGRGARTAGASPGAADPSVPPDLIVYYMDMGKDCTTCLYLETYTRETLERHFADALASGRIEWRRRDLDDPSNAHYIREFRLYTKSVVLVRQVNGEPVRHESLSRIWELVYDKEAFQTYIQREVRRFLDDPEAPE